MKIINKKVMIIALGIFVVVAQVIISISFANNTGTDDKSVDVINELAPNYKPWANSIWEPKWEYSELLLFALQALIGVSVFTYFILKQKSKTVK